MDLELKNQKGLHLLQLLRPRIHVVTIRHPHILVVGPIVESHLQEIPSSFGTLAQLLVRGSAQLAGAFCSKGSTNNFTGLHLLKLNTFATKGRTLLFRPAPHPH